MTAIPATESNRNLAAAVHRRINADGTMVSAKAWLWRWSGLGMFAMLSGIGVGAALYGYSYVSDDQPLADRMALSFAKALEHVQVPVKMTEPGTVTMTSPGQVEMTKPGEVEMKKPGEVVMTKPGSVTGTVTGDFPRPTQQQMTGDQPGANQSKSVTNFAIFKIVPRGTGEVVTGWQFLSSDQTAPAAQFCYYNPTQNAEATQTNWMVVASKLTSVGRRPDYAEVLSQCVWFNGQPPY